MRFHVILFAYIGLLSGCSTVIVYKLPETSGPKAHMVDERKDEFNKYRYFRRSAAAQLGDENLNPHPMDYLAERLGEAGAWRRDTRIMLRSFIVLLVAPIAHEEASGGVASNAIGGALSPALRELFDPVNGYGLTSDFVYVYILLGTEEGDIDARVRVSFRYYTDMPECRDAVIEALEGATDELIRKLDEAKSTKVRSGNVSR